MQRSKGIVSLISRLEESSIESNTIEITRAELAIIKKHLKVKTTTGKKTRIVEFGKVKRIATFEKRAIIGPNPTVCPTCGKPI